MPRTAVSVLSALVNRYAEQNESNEPEKAYYILATLQFLLASIRLYPKLTVEDLLLGLDVTGRYSDERTEQPHIKWRRGILRELSEATYQIFEDADEVPESGNLRTCIGFWHTALEQTTRIMIGRQKKQRARLIPIIEHLSREQRELVKEYQRLNQ